MLITLLTLLIHSSLYCIPGYILSRVHFLVIQKTTDYSITFLTIPLFSLILGIALQKIYNPPLLLSLTMHVVTSLVFSYYATTIARYDLDLIFLGIFVITSGCIIFALHTTFYETSQSYGISYGKTLQGTVINREELLNATYTEKEITLYLTLTGVTTIDHQHHTLYLPYLIALRTDYRNQLQPGDSVVVEMKKRKKNKGGNPPSSNSFTTYLQRNQILASFFPYEYCITTCYRPRWSWRRYITSIRNNLCKRLRKKMNPKSYEYFLSIFLGYKKTPLLDEDKNLFGIWGISHYLARSGLHITLFLAIWHQLFTWIPIRLQLKLLIMIIITLIYYVLSWPSISFIRSFSLFLLYQGGFLLQQPVHFFHLFSVVCIATLLLNPFHLFFLDFQLSFGLTYALALLGTHLNRTRRDDTMH